MTTSKDLLECSRGVANISGSVNMSSLQKVHLSTVQQIVTDNFSGRVTQSVGSWMITFEQNE